MRTDDRRAVVLVLVAAVIALSLSGCGGRDLDKLAETPANKSDVNNPSPEPESPPDDDPDADPDADPNADPNADPDADPAGQFCGGFGDIPCPDGYTCVDDPSDDCDPTGNGADCGGICALDPAGPGAVTVAADKDTYEVGQEAWATITNQTSDSVFLSGCTQVSRQLEQNGQWIDMGRLSVCVWEGLAIEVAAGDAYTELTEIRFGSAGTWRLSLRYGVGCTAGEPLSEAGCSSFETVYSAPITVTEVTTTAGVLVETDKSQYTVGEAATAKVINQSSDDIFLEGCTQVTWQQLVDGLWQDKSGAICFWEGIAVQVKAGATHAVLQQQYVSSPGTWRVAARYGLGCQVDMPLSAAGCSSFETVYSAQFTVTP